MSYLTQLRQYSDPNPDPGLCGEKSEHLGFQTRNFPLCSQLSGFSNPYEIGFVRNANPDSKD